MPDANGIIRYEILIPRPFYCSLLKPDKSFYHSMQLKTTSSIFERHMNMNFMLASIIDQLSPNKTGMSLVPTQWHMMSPYVGNISIL